jgi:hypothetical protein
MEKSELIENNLAMLKVGINIIKDSSNKWLKPVCFCVPCYILKYNMAEVTTTIK